MTNLPDSIQKQSARKLHKLLLNRIRQTMKNIIINLRQSAITADQK